MNCVTEEGHVRQHDPGSGAGEEPEFQAELFLKAAPDGVLLHPAQYSLLPINSRILHVPTWE